ncbi:hypothetical protein [Tenacibaculum finnmarkense]|uniref:hypothetical protein n=1 Tax=Tenacibaculum finnmarkense TaxID=2781243 RepID=UPI00187B3790|nr:hypothetical protein [Tenacibaculum finnmarkense]MBE7661510.1 hypothetical protein [Tenacibaculum finnmarkense genomovar finnmarkense]MCG8253221.1 hypothetical protein [Tenacibaculum finnmarkense genomovar finnmarkense]MCG8816725.1 hypothetical protein [Tenacibaculum finnmarkense]MCG8821719.1 hypothetical protein [Tenacibaculum finnmarkense]
MSNWKEKSTQNQKSAGTLINNKLYSPSIHCSYYSNIQLMLHILLNDFEKSEARIDAESQQGSIDEKGFHNWLKNIITRELFGRDFMSVRDFNNFFGQLKSLRIKSDYKNMLIIESRAKNGLDLSKKIISILEDKFEV